MRQHRNLEAGIGGYVIARFAVCFIPVIHRERPFAAFGRNVRYPVLRAADPGISM
jgi:hypothetical protein